MALHSILRHTRCVFPHPLLRKNRCVVVFPHRMLHGWAGETAGRRRPGGVGREASAGRLGEATNKHGKCYLDGPRWAMELVN